jgi:hypothetical protein
MELLTSRPELEVLIQHNVIWSHDRGLTHQLSLQKLIVWPEDRACERSWLLENIPGAVGVIVMLTDKVN